jgi:hypothetical protein
MRLTWIRLGLSLTGMAVAVLSIMLKDRRLVWGAIALLAASLILRLMQRKKGPGEGGS